jgi:predicted DNA-binding protein
VAYTQIKIKLEYREKLAKLAQSQNRSMANTIEVLIDQAVENMVDSEVGTNVH